jgi:class 3 adenylate cyclase
MVRDVAEWLRGLGLEQYAAQFHGNDIDGAVLPDLTAEDLIGLGVGSIGHRRKLLAAIAALRDRGARPTPAAEATPSSTAGAERRQLTIMFCDLVGSTALATRLDPEDLREIIAAYHRRVSEVLTRFGGFVAKYMGDGVLAYFGYPEAHEDDAERAVRAGLAIVDRVAALALAEPLQVRIGIATGSAVVGDLIGSGAAQEQTVVGETPNLAARLQALAEPGALVIAESTRRQLGSLFDMDDLGPQALKGFAEAQRAWRVAGESNVESRFAALRSGETPLVGREEELDLLLRRWAQAKAGEGRVVLLSAEPGIGKSRLTEALLQRVAAEKPAELRCFCSPHHQDSALFPIIAQLERAAGFAREDGPAAKREKLAALLAESAAPADDLPLLAELLSLPGAPSSPAPELPPQRKKELTFAALLGQIERLARRRPVLMAFEDLHWIDPTSRELLDRIVALVDHLPILLIATFRPEFQPPWTGQAHVTLLALNRLGRSIGAALVRQLAGDARPLPAEIVDEIVERTDGVPLFLEEVTKVVLEAAGAATAGGALAAIPGARVAVPATLQASLMARLDRLGPVCRETAQTGSAIGRNFSYELLQAVSPRSEGETLEALDRLVAAGLVFQRGTPPMAEYQFKHALVQDTAYGTLLRGPRQALHARIAEMLAAGRGEAAGAAPEIVAHHLQSAGRSAEAIGYWRQAGEQAVRRAANREAIGHFRRALALVAAEPDTPERGRTELAILSKLGPALMSIHGWSAPEVGEVVERAAEVGRGLPSSSELAPAIANLWIFNVARGRLDRAAEISADVFRIGQELRDPEVMLQAHHCAWARATTSGGLPKPASTWPRGRRFTMKSAMRITGTSISVMIRVYAC